MGWDRHELLWTGMGQKNTSHGQASSFRFRENLPLPLLQLSASLPHPWLSRTKTQQTYVQAQIARHSERSSVIALGLF